MTNLIVGLLIGFIVGCFRTQIVDGVKALIGLFYKKGPTA